MSETVTQELHLPHGSHWPILFALAITITTLAIVFQGVWLLVGFLALTATGIGWIKEDIKWYKERVGTGEGVGLWGTMFFIGSEIMIFGALFATYFNFKLRSGDWGPPEGAHLPLGPTTMFTIILLFSGVTMHWSHAALRQGDMRKFKGHLILTILLGLVFLGGQVNEYITLIGEGMTLSSHPFGSTFYMLTGTHGLHVAAGLVYLIIVAIRHFGWGQQDQERHTALETAAIYWHFVDLVWVFVFGIIYLDLL